MLSGFDCGRQAEPERRQDGLDLKSAALDQALHPQADPIPPFAAELAKRVPVIEDVDIVAMPRGPNPRLRIPTRHGIFDSPIQLVRGVDRVSIHPAGRVNREFARHTLSSYTAQIRT